ncbi:cell division protein ZapE [Halomonas binhaiensis]|uniref:cell division protein ZapE n=1 Tax=Halomonas binhaiensis TaxID=2562282 RepID=UPI0023DE089E|nr:cell division protein ZapE [Halomonas binhaiensis]
MPNSSPTVVMQADDSVLTSVTSPLSPVEAYQAALEAGRIVEDAAQWRAVEMLDECHQALKGSSLKADGRAIAGVYLWGSVGRGKTWLMDRFVLSCPVPVRRWHFHHFMRWVHQRQFHWRGRPDPLAALAEELVAEVKVLCLDELYVEDIADATLLGGLLIRLFERDLVVIATSNQPRQSSIAMVTIVIVCCRRSRPWNSIWCWCTWMGESTIASTLVLPVSGTLFSVKDNPA